MVLLETVADPQAAVPTTTLTVSTRDSLDVKLHPVVLFRIVNIFTPPKKTVHSLRRVFEGLSFEIDSAAVQRFAPYLYPQGAKWLSVFEKDPLPVAVRIEAPRCAAGLWQIYPSAERFRQFRTIATATLNGVPGDAPMRLNMTTHRRGKFTDTLVRIDSLSTEVRYDNDSACVWPVSARLGQMQFGLCLTDMPDPPYHATLELSCRAETEVNVLFAQIQHLMDYVDIFSALPKHHAAPPVALEKEFRLSLNVQMTGLKLRLPRDSYHREHMEITARHVGRDKYYRPEYARPQHR